MKAILIEDEEAAASNLEHILNEIEPNLEIVETIETVSDAISFFKQRTDFDLVFMDIHLADGNSFEIMKEVEPSAPIIFTTAYDQYAIQAFKLNSIDYLLKPVRESDLKNALLKFKDKEPKSQISHQQLEALLVAMEAPKRKYRSSFLVQKKDTYTPVAAEDFAFFFIQDGVVRGTTKSNQTYIINEKLEDLEEDLNPELFFRANRQYLIERSAIQSFQTYFNGRFVLNLLPRVEEKVIVSKANASKLKAWLQDMRGKP